MLERNVDRRVCDYAKKKYQLLCIKLTMLGRYGIAGLPDRLFLGWGPVFFFAEMKRPGKEPTERQWKMISVLQRWGFHVEVIDTVPKGKAYIDHVVALMRGGRRLRRVA